MVFVTLNDIKILIKDKCKEVSELLGLSEDEALIILNYFKWRKDLVENEWFGNEKKIFGKAGLDPIVTAILNDSNEILCAMCFDTKPASEFDNLKCNHQICKDCWTDYINFCVYSLDYLYSHDHIGYEAGEPVLLEMSIPRL